MSLTITKLIQIRKDGGFDNLFHQPDEIWSSSIQLTGGTATTYHDRLSVDQYFLYESGEKMVKIFDGKKSAKLGTEKNPAVVHVKTKKRMDEVVSIFEKNNWKYTIELDKENPEDIKDLEILLNWPKTQEAEKKIGRNEPCPCGSGKKYKKCCGK